MSAVLRRVSKNSNCIFVKDFSWSLTKQELTQYFSQFGKVVAITLVVSWNTGLSQRKAFVEFESQNVVNNILTQQHKQLNKPIFLKQ